MALSVVVTYVSKFCFSFALNTAAAKFGVGAADVAVIGTAVSTRGVATVLWCCWYYSSAVIVAG